MYKHWNDWYKIEPPFCPKLKTNYCYYVGTKRKKYINNDGGIRERPLLPIRITGVGVGAVALGAVVAAAVMVDRLCRSKDPVAAVVFVLGVDRDWMEHKKNLPLGIPNWKISIIKSKMNVEEDGAS
jgi:hypothetical protein